VLEQYFGDYITVAVFLAAGVILVGAALITAGMIRPNKPSKVKSEIYECGIEPIGDGWSQTHIRYYIFALLFLVFDVEAVFIFPWALNVETFANAGSGGYILIEMFVFIGILLLGLVYAVRKGVLKWE
jgi:NADH-quinone oxidoreductase subunit A